MIVEAIEWLSSEASEALVTVVSGNYTCIAFCHPCSVEVRDQITSPLVAFLTEDIISSESALGLERAGDSLGYRIVGVLRSVDPPIVAVGGLAIEIEEQLPGDLRINDRVEFYCSRLDLCE